MPKYNIYDYEFLIDKDGFSYRLDTKGETEEEMLNNAVVVICKDGEEISEDKLYSCDENFYSMVEKVIKEYL